MKGAEMTSTATGAMTAGDAFAALMEDYLVTAGFAVGALDAAEAVYPAPWYAAVPRGTVTVCFAGTGDVTLGFTPAA
jgi:hypothetical protein